MKEPSLLISEIDELIELQKELTEEEFNDYMAMFYPDIILWEMEERDILS